MTRIAPTGRLRIGTLGWRSHSRPNDPPNIRGGELRAYAAEFDVVEVNTTFYRTPTVQTFGRWAESTPPGFRFALELPEAICRQLPSGIADEAVRRFLDAVEPLGAKLAVVVVHLPAQFVFDAAAQRALTILKARIPVQLVCEAHDASWLGYSADRFLAACGIPRVGVLAGPGLVGSGPGGWRDLEYVRVRKLPRGNDPDILARLQAAARGAQDRWWILEKEAGELAAALATWSRAGDGPPPLRQQAS